MKSDHHKKNHDVVVIGAGICGLSVAARLSRKGYKVAVIEAQSHPGGRIHSVKGCLSTVHAGAEFVHGNLPFTKKLIKKAGGELIEHKGAMYRSHNGVISKAHEPVPHMNAFMKKAKKLKTDMSLTAFLDAYFTGEEYTDLRVMCIRMAEGFDAADADRISVKSLHEEWSGDAIESSYVIKEGYDMVVQYLMADCLKQGCDFYFNSPAIFLRWQRNSVKAETASGKIIHADRAVVTVVLTELLKDSPQTLRLVPAIPELPVLINQLGFGGVIKVIIEFRSFFWRSPQDKIRVFQIPDLGFMFCDEEFPVFWTSAVDLPVITCWVGGGQARRLKHHPDHLLKKKAISSLANAFLSTEKTIQQEIIGTWVFNWFNAPFAHGAYSYDTVNTAEARDKLNEPVENTVFFAGEALRRGATVEAALESADSVVKKIRKLK